MFNYFGALKCKNNKSNLSELLIWKAGSFYLKVTLKFTRNKKLET